MCGIAGIVAADRLDADDRDRVHPACATSSRIAGRTTAGLFVDAQAGARPSPAEHRRPGRRPSAAVQRGRHASGSSSTARSTTTRDVRVALEAAGHRYRTRCDTETIVHAYEQWGDALRRSPARHVRVRDLGCAATPAAARPRSARRQAALLGDGRRPAAVRLRDQVDPRRAA